MPGKRPEPSFEFIQLLASHQSRLYAYVLSLLCDRTQAEDAMQEANAVLRRKAHDFELASFGSALASSQIDPLFHLTPSN